MDDNDILSNSYMAGLVKRYHTRPTTRLQTVADHSWQVMRIWWHIWGPMPPHISTHLLWHDAAELATGDVPHYAKRDAPALKRVLNGLEDPALVRMGGPRLDEDDTGVGLTGEERAKFKVCDLIEMLEFAIVEIGMGNNFQRPTVANCYRALRLYIPSLDIKDVLKVGAYVRKVLDAAEAYGVDIPAFALPVKEEHAA